MSILTGSAVIADVVATTKISADGEALPKQYRSDGEVSTPMLLNTHLSEGNVRGPTMYDQTPRKQKQRKLRKESIQDHASTYKVLTELAYASSGLTFGQVIRGDADDSMKKIRKLISRRSNLWRFLVGPVVRQPKRLKVVPVMRYGSQIDALLDSGAVLNLISTKLCDQLSLEPKDSSKKINSNGSSAVCKGIIYNVPIAFGGMSVPLDFLVIDGPLFDIIVGCPTLEMLHACLDLGSQQVKMRIA